MLNKFADYMYYLLHSPLKKVEKYKNQIHILFKVLGRIFDQTKQDIFKVREQSMIISASGKMLDEHGKDRGMKRLPEESEEYYRNRLMLKKVIAEKAGTIEGLLLTLQAMGYEKSYIEPYYIHDPTRWAEFIIYLRSEKPSGMNNISVIDEEVMRVKPASGKPSYGVEDYTDIHIHSGFKDGFSKFPLCGVTICGMYPRSNNLAKVFEVNLRNTSQVVYGDVNYPLAGRTASSEKKYQQHSYVDYSEFKSVIEGTGKTETKEIQYIRCNEVVSGQYPNKQNTAKVFESNIESKSSNKDGVKDYPLCGEVKCEGVNNDENPN
jgi:hypothetical protein